MSDSLRWPAEWEPQAAVMLTWPRPDGDFRDFAAIHAGHVALAEALAAHAPLIIAVNDDDLREVVRSALSRIHHRVQLQVVPSNDVWVRDHGPVGVLDGARVILRSYTFDGWGGKYPADRDNALIPALAERGVLAALGEVQPVDLTLEGGGIDTDGQGTLLATRSSVLDPRRNPGKDADAIESLLRDTLGVDRFLWLDHGDLAGDDTDGHIDTLARFVAPDHIVYQGSQDTALPNDAALTALATELRALRQRDGQPYRLTMLPHTVSAHEGSDGLLPTSYANFLMLNGAILVPQYDDPSDAAALATLRAACPQAAVIGVDCQALVHQYGSLHCATMNIPAAVS